MNAVTTNGHERVRRTFTSRKQDVLRVLHLTHDKLLRQELSQRLPVGTLPLPLAGRFHRVRGTHRREGARLARAKARKTVWGVTAPTFIFDVYLSHVEGLIDRRLLERVVVAGSKAGLEVALRVAHGNQTALLTCEQKAPAQSKLLEVLLAFPVHPYLDALGEIRRGDL